MAQLVIDIPDELARRLERAASESHASLETFVVDNLTSSVNGMLEPISLAEIEEFRRSIREARLSGPSADLGD